jgi:hypothetical protein
MNGAYLNQSSPTFYGGGGGNSDRVISPSILEQNTVNLQAWASNISQYLQSLDARIKASEKFIKWTAQTYPEVVEGYKAVQDVERSANE